MIPDPNNSCSPHFSPHSVLPHPGTGEVVVLSHSLLSLASAGRSNASERMIEMIMCLIFVCGNRWLVADKVLRRLRILPMGLGHVEDSTMKTT
jgi:hypothetical protein